MSPTMSVLLLIGNLSEIYCTSECLYIYSKYPQPESQGYRACWRQKSTGRPALLCCIRWEPRCRASPGTRLQDHWQLHSPSSPRLWGYCSRISVDTSSCSSSSPKLYGKKLHSLSEISLMPFSISKPLLHSFLITKGSRTWFPGGLALVPSFQS